ncbi:MAG: selenocysteine-specific translation elongation factor [Tissierellia bacterium]|nr:selenocysteine-specific translation elongation factor [Tissierellia bacterium]
MKHFILGTAGHIDHGKTSLVRGLTGRNTDRLEEEQKRGITIDLGFTYYDDPTGIRIGIVDVPGHEKFVRNMLAGVHGMDMVLMVIAADEGIMPQTKEHLHILELLGVEKGIVVLTKKDMVEEEWAELVREDIHDQLQGTFLKDAPIVLVSSKTLEGFDELKDLISKAAQELDDVESEKEGILPVDRVFSLKGIGTVVTGTQIMGKFSVGDEVMIYPQKLETKIRSLQVHGEDTTESHSSQRVAMNLNKLKTEDIERGSVVAFPESLLVSDLLDAKLVLLEDSPYTLKNKSRVRFYVSSTETFARVHLLDRDELLPGESAFVQLKLEEKISARRKDKFIIRFFSPVITIGGGEILELQASRKKRFKEEALHHMALKDGDILQSAMGILLDHKKDYLTLNDLSRHMNIEDEEAKTLIETLEDQGKAEILKDHIIVLKEDLAQLKENILALLTDFHKNQPLRTGIPVEEVRNRFFKGLSGKIQDILLERIAAEEEIGTDKEVLFKSDFIRTYTDQDKKQMEQVLLLMEQENRLYRKDELGEISSDLVSAMAADKKLVDIHGEYLTHAAFLKAQNALYQWFKEHEELDVKEYRDLCDTNRKTAVGLLEYFDAKKITKRNGDVRVLLKRKDI